METDRKFIKGFNAGYLLAKHNPKLSQSLKRGMQENENSYVQGFFKGTIEFNNEEKLKRIKEQKSKTRKKGKNKRI